jgi:hypothetical protein
VSNLEVDNDRLHGKHPLVTTARSLATMAQHHPRFTATISIITVNSLLCTAGTPCWDDKRYQYHVSANRALVFTHSDVESTAIKCVARFSASEHCSTMKYNLFMVQRPWISLNSQEILQGRPDADFLVGILLNFINLRGDTDHRIIKC